MRMLLHDHFKCGGSYLHKYKKTADFIVQHVLHDRLDYAVIIF